MHWKLPALKHKVELSEAERSRLKELTRGGRVSARKLKRARPGQKSKLNGKQEAHLGFAEDISLETARQSLKKRT